MSDVASLKAGALAQIAALQRDRATLRRRQNHIAYGGGPLAEDYADFNARCLAVVDRVTGRHDAYYEEALREVGRHGSLTSPALTDSLFGLVRSLKSDLEGGYLVGFREVVHAAVLGDLLNTAASLLKQHVDAGAVLVGCVLDAHLRRLAVKYDVTATGGNVGGEDIWGAAERLNDDLSGVLYGRTEQRAVASWLAACRWTMHETTGGPGSARTASLAQYVREFIARYPA